MNMELNKVLALNVSGQPLDIISYEKAAFYAAKDLIAWSIGSQQTLHGGIQRISGLQSTLDIDTIIAIKGKNFNRVRPPKITNDLLFRRDLNICAYCGQTFYNSQLTRDHIIPKVQGGKNTWNNVVTSCSPCNKYKGGHRPEEVGLELLYVPYVPCENEFIILKHRNILEDQMEYLLKNIKNNKSRIEEIIEYRVGNAQKSTNRRARKF